MPDSKNFVRTYSLIGINPNTYDKGHQLRICMIGNDHMQFCSGKGRGNPPTDRNRLRLEPHVAPHNSFAIFGPYRVYSALTASSLNILTVSSENSCRSLHTRSSFFRISLVTVII
jgi:hypothetical protein